MTRDEIRGLMGGYATGSLTDAERKVLFDAAIEDQELFDELAAEQSLKEALDEPGAKQRLIAALAQKESAPQKKLWWKDLWVWAAVGTVTAAAVIGIALMQRQPEQQIAGVEVPARPSPVAPTESAPSAAAPIQPATPPKVLQQASPAPTADALRKAVPEPETLNAPAQAVGNLVAPQVAQAPPPPPAPAAAAPQVAARRDAEPPQLAAPRAAEAPPAPASTTTGALKTEAQSVEQAKTTAAPAPQAFGAAGGVIGGVPPGPAAAGVGGGRGGRGGGGGGARALALDAARPPFAFNYAVTPAGLLSITPAVNGFLSVSVSTANSASAPLTNRPVTGGEATQIQLAADAVSALVIFSARETPPDFIQYSGPPLNDPPAGTKSDPNPTQDSRLYALIRIQR